MIDQLLNKVPNGNPKTVTNWLQVDRYIWDRTENWKKRFMLSSPTFTTGVELLRFLVLNTDMEYVLSMESDIDRFSLVINNMPDSLKASFDNAYNSSIQKQVFTKGSPRIPEFFLNTTYANKHKVYPFDTPWNDNWKNLRGFRLIHHDANELLGDFLKWSIEFTSHQPTYCIFSIDVTTLIFKYVKYTEYCNQNNQEPLFSAFLLESELPHLFEDFHRVWQINFINDLLDPSKDPNQVVLDTAVPQFYCGISSIKRMAQDVINMKSLMEQGSVKLADFLSTRWFLQGTQNFFDLYNSYQTESLLPDLRQYRYLELLREFPLFKMFFLVYNAYAKYHSSEKYYLLTMEYVLRDLSRQNLSASVLNPAVRSVFQDNMKLYTSLINSK